MRTKTAFLAAAALAASLATSVAQSNVYSINVVGYVNQVYTNGFQLISNPLDFDGSGINNSLQTVFGTNLPTLTRVWAFSSPSYVFVTYTASTAKWTGNTNAINAALQLGGGVFLQYPAAQPLLTNTVVGTVLQGTLSNNIAPVYQIISSQVPQSGGLVTDLGYQGVTLDRVYQYNTPTQKYGSPHTYNASTKTWTGGEPLVGVGESFWLLGHAGSAWVRTFTVGP